MIAETLEKVTSGEIKRLIISMPPRHGKSLAASVYFPAWHLGQRPDDRIIACSYSAELSNSFSRQARNLVRSPEYADVFGSGLYAADPVGLADDSRSVGMWDLSAPHRGGYVSAGVGGSITGKGAHVLVIDDPVKDAEEAKSETVLQNIWEWYSQTAYSRLEGDGAVVLIMTRWSEDDLVGRVLAQADEHKDDPRYKQWHELVLPALAEENDPLGRAEGEALWPSKYDEDWHYNTRLVLGEQAYSALYQQRPAPAEGNMWKRAWWQYYDRNGALPKFRRVIQCWDTAYKEGQENDYSACITMGMAERSFSAEREGNVVSLRRQRVFDLYLLDVFKKKVIFTDMIEEMQRQYDKWAEVPGCRPMEILIEDKASGTSAFQMLRHASNLPVISVKPEGDKIARANGVTAWYRLGRVLHPRGAAWLDEYQHELEVFPAGKHDDTVDATTMAVLRLLGPASASAFLSHLRGQVTGRAAHERNEIALPEGIRLVQ